MAYNIDDYEPVEKRLAQFWSDHPNGRVLTQLLKSGDGEFIVHAACYREGDERPMATGLAHEVVDPKHFVNRHSALENCETSALGRCLANANYATKARPSREEMEKVERHSQGASAPDPEKVKAAEEAVKSLSAPAEEQLWKDLYSLLERPVNDMTVAEMSRHGQLLHQLVGRLGLPASFKACEDEVVAATGKRGWKSFAKDEKVLALTMFVNEIKDEVGNA